MIRSMVAIPSAAVLLLYSTSLGGRAAELQTAADGQKVYASQKCSICHSIAKETRRDRSTSSAASPRQRKLRQWIVNAKEMAAKHKATRDPAMKDFSQLPAKDVDALVAYLSTLRK